MSHRLLATVAVVALALQGCAPATVAPPGGVADDLTEGMAKTCSFTPAQPVVGTTVQSTITQTNDGWCAYRASEKPGQPYLLGLVRQRPEHGELLIRKWAGETRVEYNPEARFVGTDKFVVALRPSDGTADDLVQITAIVSQGAGVAAPVVAPEPAKPTTRRPTTRRPVKH